MLAVATLARVSYHASSTPQPRLKHASTEMLPQLPRAHRPRGALAVVNQSKQLNQTMGPRGMELSPNHTKKRTNWGPTACSASHLGTLLDGYLSSRMLCHATAPGHAVHLLKAENAELLHAAKCLPAADDSLPPRPVAVVLLVYGSASTSGAASAYLDALGHFAASRVDEGNTASPRVATTMRMTVLAGDDAAWFAGKVEEETLNSSPEIGPGKIDVVVRWGIPGRTEMLRSEFTALRSECNLSAALEQVQNFMLSMKLVYDVPISDDITRSHTQIAPDEWAHTLHDATRDFFDSMEGEPCVSKSAVLRDHENEVSVEASDVFLRIAPRKHWDQATRTWVELCPATAVGHPEAFHAFLIGNAGYLQEIIKFCQAHAMSGLPTSDHDSEVYLLHTCAVQATPMHLGHSVSLYGRHGATGRVPGTPISQPGSMMWRFDSAIVPLDDVLRGFHVLPCARASALPGDPKLERPFGNFFDRAFKLYTSFVSGKDVRRLRSLSPLPAIAEEPKDASLKTCEMYALTSFGLEASSQDLTTGDAYAVLKSNGAPKELTDFMLSSCVSNGVNSSVLTALSSAAQALQKMRGGVGAYDVKEIRRLKRVADASLLSNTSNKRKTIKPMTPPVQPVQLEATRVRSLLAACGLVKGQETIVHFREMSSERGFVEVVEVIASCVARRASDEAKHHASETARSMSRKGVVKAVSAAMCVLRAAPGARIAPAFVVHQEMVQGEDKITFSRVLPCGGLEECTAGVILDTAHAVVVLLRIGKSARVTATVRD